MTARIDWLRIGIISQALFWAVAICCISYAARPDDSIDSGGPPAGSSGPSDSGSGDTQDSGTD